MMKKIARILTLAEIVIRGQIRRKDIYVVYILLGTVIVLLSSLDILGISSVVTYLLEIGLLTAWVFGWILAVYSSARELPQEETRGTIFSLLSKPVTRAEIVVGKWAGCWSSVTVAVALFYALVVALVFMRDGFINPVALFQAFILHAGALAVMTSITVTFSTRMNQDAAATLAYILTGASFLVTPRIPEFVFKETGMRSAVLLFLYHSLPHFEVLDMRARVTFGFGPAPWKPFAASIAYAASMTVFFLAISAMLYDKKRFSRSEMAVL